MAIEIANKNYSSPGSGESDPYVNKKKKNHEYLLLDYEGPVIGSLVLQSL